MADFYWGKNPQGKGKCLQMGKQVQKCYETCFRAEVEHRGGGPSSSKFTGPESPCLTTWPPEACLHLTPGQLPPLQAFRATGTRLTASPERFLGKAGRSLESFESNRETESGQVLARN